MGKTEPSAQYCIMLSIVMLKALMLSIVVPLEYLETYQDQFEQITL